MLVDGGPPEADVVGKLRSAGVRSLDLVVLTHAQRDHQGGLDAVLREMPVGMLLDGGRGAGDRTHREIVALARARGTRVARAARRSNARHRGLEAAGAEPGLALPPGGRDRRSQ